MKTTYTLREQYGHCRNAIGVLKGQLKAQRERLRTSSKEDRYIRQEIIQRLSGELARMKARARELWLK